MPAKLHLLLGLDHAAITARMLNEAEQTLGIGTTLWLTPSRASADDLLRRLVRRGRLRLAPQVLSLPSLVHGQRGLPRTSQQRILLQQLVHDTDPTKELAYYRRVLHTKGFTEAALRFIVELNDLGVTPTEVLDLRRAVTTPAWRGCAHLYHAWHMATAKQATRRLPSMLKNVRTVFVLGCTTFTNAEWSVLEQLAAQAQTMWFSLPDAPVEQSEAMSTPHVMRAELERRFGKALTTKRQHVVPFTPRPTGLQHLLEHLFGVTRQGADATGVELIEAPGELGEARLVARRIRTALNAGLAPSRVVVAVRDLSGAAELLADVFAEYGIPTHIAGDEPLAQVPVVASLVRAAQLAELGWPFADVTALLRSNYFRPAWPTATTDIVAQAEILLRLLGEPRGRDAYLQAVDLWADTPPKGLEDEQAEESRRQRKTALAGVARPFLRQFFHAWDTRPEYGSAAEWTTWLQHFATNIGLNTIAMERDRDVRALTMLWEALAAWQAPALKAPAFFRGLATIVNSEMIARTPVGCGAVRVVPAHEARHLDCDELYVLGLGEGSFPRLTAPDSLLDDGLRATLRTHGVPFPDPAWRLADEQLLFLQLLAAPQQRLILSYPAVDEKGQPLLPGTFLRAVRDCFAANVVPVTHQRMLIEGYLDRPPLALAEARVQFAHARHGQRDTTWQAPGFPATLGEQLRQAAYVAHARFHTTEHNEYDGLLAQSAVRATVQERFGATKVFSPTALESYVYCPFQFFMAHVLRLEELDEPSSEVEQTRRGSAFHRALARMHTKLRDIPEFTHAQLPATVTSELHEALTTAIDEYIHQAPSPAAKKLWQLERQRLGRSVVKYRDHWEKYLAPWREHDVHLEPRWLEADFGLPVAEQSMPEALTIDIQGIRVQVGGRIDRVDVATMGDELGFWIIDYKTGNTSHYTAKAVQQFEKLQLPLYALAVENVLAKDRKARPLGMAYWLVTDTGVKPVLPGTGKKSLGWLAEEQHWRTFRKQLEQWIAEIVAHIRDGQFPLAPRSEQCTTYCPYQRVCRISQSRHVGKAWQLSLPVLDEEGPSDR